MSVERRAVPAQPTDDEHWQQNRNIRVDAMSLHLQQRIPTINAALHDNQIAFI